MTKSKNKINNLSVVLIALFISYVLFFVIPIFFNSQHHMAFYVYVRAWETIGADLSQMMVYTNSLLAGHSPFIANNNYAPLVSILFIPFALIQFNDAFVLLTIFTFICYVWTCIVLPYKMTGKIATITALLFVLGLFSYGFQWELERAQWYTVTMCFILMSIYSYHYKHNWKLAFIFLTVAIQLKLMPVIFVLCFYENRKAIKKIVGLLAANVALLFILGWQAFFDFIALVNKGANNSMWHVNHSLAYYSFIHQYDQTTIIFLYALIIGMILFICWRKELSIKVLACTLGNMLLPAISHDTKLAMLVPAMIWVLHKEYKIVLVFPLVFLFFMTLYSYVTLPVELNCKFPILFAMLCLLCVFPDDKRNTVVKIIREKNLDKE
jgi:hypothetical protein